jgi:hypothetical protein
MKQQNYQVKTFFHKNKKFQYNSLQSAKENLYNKNRIRINKLNNKSYKV